MSGSTVIHVGQAEPAYSGFADYFDGQTAAVRRVGMTIQDTSAGPVLVLTPPDTPSVKWPMSDIRGVPDQAGKDTLVLALKGDPVARLVVADQDGQTVLRARCKNLRKRPPSTGKAKLIAWALGAVASVALIVFVLVPVMANQLAEYLPVKGERALGEATFQHVRTALSSTDLSPIKICEDADGLAALSKIQTRLEANITLPYPLTVYVLDHSMVNAFALPGGQIVIFRGLIDAAEDPNEVAAVFAHEIGHVVHRDPARGALRSAGSIGVLGLLLGDFAGGFAVKFLVNRLIDATYSQDAESLADTFAHETLTGTGLPPSALATMFERLRDEHGEADGIVAHFQAHPKLGNRIEAARNADPFGADENVRALTRTEWKSLQNVCE